MNPNLFRYIWRHSRRDQLIIFAVVIASLPFYFASLDLPRRIVNEAIQGRAFERGQQTARFPTFSLELPQWLGGWQVFSFEGIEVDRLGLLYGLSGMFLLLVIINGAFKYWINVAKGALGERMLRRMRFELFSLIMRFTPEALRTVKASETATIIKDEVEPIGGFIGDAFVLPLFLGTQAATALIFILVQNIWLGLIAAGIVGVQFLIIPRLRRELLRLGKQRQLASRRLAGRIGEVVDGIEVVHVHNAATWERAEIGHRLYELFDIRFRIYKRKFIVKFLNNFLAQLTPFFFYSVGGYFALRGQLDIGQLVAVIAAYRELPPPLKELIDWDQQRLDVQVKYDQVVQHFAPERLGPAEDPAAALPDTPLTGELVVENLSVPDPQGGFLLEGLALRYALPARLAIVSDGTPAAGIVARILAGREGGYGGCVKIGEHDLSALPRQLIGRRVAYAGVEAILFPGQHPRQSRLRAAHPAGHERRRGQGGGGAAAGGGEAHRQSAREHRGSMDRLRARRRVRPGRARSRCSSSASRSWASRRTSTVSACPARSIPSVTRTSPDAWSRRGPFCARSSKPPAGRISSSRSIRSATTRRRRSPRTSCSACRPRAT